MPRLHAGAYTKLRVARQILGLNRLVVLHGVAATPLTMQALALLKAIKHKTHRAIADCMDARVNAPFLRPDNGGTDALWILRGLTAGIGRVGIGFKHPSGVVGAHAIKKLLKAVPLDLRTREGVFLLDLLER